MKDITVRLNLSYKEHALLREILAIHNCMPGKEQLGLDEERVKKLHEKINNPKNIFKSEKKENATKKATEARTKKAKEKIQNAINLLRLENKKITHYSIAKIGEVSYQTVKNHITLNEIEALK